MARVARVTVVPAVKATVVPVVKATADLAAKAESAVPLAAMAVAVADSHKTRITLQTRVSNRAPFFVCQLSPFFVLQIY